MAAMRIRARVRDGHLESVEKIDLPEGEEVTLTLDLPVTRRAAVPPQATVFQGSHLRGPFPLTREQIYGDR